MTARCAANAPRRRGAGAARLANPVRPDLSLEPGAGGRERVDRNVFVDVNRLSVLAKVVQTREAPRAMALERAFARVFPGMLSAQTIAAVAPRNSTGRGPRVFT